MIGKIIIFSFLIQNSLALHDPTRFCRITHEEQCVQNRGQHSNKCGTNLCSTNDLECKEFLAYEKLAASLQKNSNKNSSLSHSMDNSKFTSFTLKIGKCKDNSPALQSNDFCLNPGGCILRQEKTRPISRLNSFASIQKTYVYRWVECPCQGLYSYQCHQDYCSTSKEACEKLIKNNYQLNAKIKTCGKAKF